MANKTVWNHKIEKKKLTHREFLFAQFVAKGEVITFDGFLKVYLEGVDNQIDEQNDLLPKVEKGEVLSLRSMTANQRFSRPPYRFTEASLVKKLEELGIGRPSTYAPTISTIQNRKYIEKGISEGESRKYIQLELSNNEIKFNIVDFPDPDGPIKE